MHAESVRGILEGRKTQTRRIVKPQPAEWIREWGYTCFTPAGHISGRGSYGDQGPAEKFYRSPYGMPGDRLWVRETWGHDWYDDGTTASKRLVYRADPGAQARDNGSPRPWSPSIHMPRWAARLTLEVTAVRVEQVQDITEVDAKAEGVERAAWPEDLTADDGALNAECGYFPPRSCIAGFAERWDALYAKRGDGWDVNPWVWCLTFRRIEGAA
jgi:hypothetical protein